MKSKDARVPTFIVITTRKCLKGLSKDSQTRMKDYKVVLLDLEDLPETEYSV